MFWIPLLLFNAVDAIWFNMNLEISSQCSGGQYYACPGRSVTIKCTYGGITPSNIGPTRDIYLYRGSSKGSLTDQIYLSEFKGQHVISGTLKSRATANDVYMGVSLTITEFNETEDALWYSCRGIIDHSVKDTFLNLANYVLVPPEIESVSTDLSDVVDEKTLITIRCVGSFLNKPYASSNSFELKVNGISKPTNGYKTVNDRHLIYVTHMKFTPEDNTIQCVLIWKKDIPELAITKVSEFKTFHVQFRPRKVSGDMSTLQVELKGTIQIDVKIKSSPHLYYYKLSNGKRELTHKVLLNRTRHHSFAESEFIFHIRQAGYNDNGTYTLTVGNGIGNPLSMDKDVVILGPPEPPKNLTEYDVTSTSVTLKWRSGVNGGSKQVFQVQYSNIYNQLSSDSSTCHSTPDPGNQKWAFCTVKELSSYEKYYFRVMAENNYNGGSYSYSEELSVWTKGRESSTGYDDIDLSLMLLLLLPLMLVMLPLVFLGKRHINRREESNPEVRREVSNTERRTEVSDPERSRAKTNTQMTGVQGNITPNISRLGDGNAQDIATVTRDAEGDADSEYEKIGTGDEEEPDTYVELI